MLMLAYAPCSTHNCSNMNNPEIPTIELEQIASGKVRDTYRLDNERLVMVASDRISAYNVVMDEEIPGKGRILNAITSYWMEKLVSVPNHSAQYSPSELPEGLKHPYYSGRIAVVRSAKMLPIECTVRGYMAGSAWQEYQQSGTVHGKKIRGGVQESDKFTQPLFTPSTKAESGEHDQNISFNEAIEIVGKETAYELRDKSVKIYRYMHQEAAAHDLIPADTKLEFGYYNGVLILCDEVGTPDSSRWWDANMYKPGGPQFSFDKQYLRDYLATLVAQGLWDKTYPAPDIPQEVIEETKNRYETAYTRITGQPIETITGVPN